MAEDVGDPNVSVETLPLEEAPDEETCETTVDSEYIDPEGAPECLAETESEDDVEEAPPDGVGDVIEIPSDVEDAAEITIDTDDAFGEDAAEVNMDEVPGEEAAEVDVGEAPEEEAAEVEPQYKLRDLGVRVRRLPISDEQAWVEMESLLDGPPVLLSIGGRGGGRGRPPGRLVPGAFGSAGRRISLRRAPGRPDWGHSRTKTMNIMGLGRSDTITQTFMVSTQC